MGTSRLASYIQYFGGGQAIWRPAHITVADFLPDFSRYAISPRLSKDVAFSSTSSRDSTWAFASFAANAASPPHPASMRTARSPAFLALPIATVATGTPLGICTMLYRESTPESADVFTGTPMTGSVVSAATMPGRWAAPPAPAMRQRSPRPAAARAYSTMWSG